MRMTLKSSFYRSLVTKITTMMRTTTTVIHLDTTATEQYHSVNS